MRGWLTKNRIMLILIGVCLVLRLIFAIPAFTDASRTAACADAEAYDQIAQNILAGNGFSMRSEAPYKINSTITPGYPYFVAAVYAIFGRARIAVILIQIILNLMALMLLYRFIKDRYGEKAATWTGILFSADFNMALFCAQQTSEILFTTFLVSALILIINSLEEGRFATAFGAGVIIGAATLVRPIALYITVPLLLFIYISHCWWRRVKLWRKILQWSIILGLQVILITPWVIRNRVVFGEFFYTTVSDVNMLRYHAAPLKAALERKSTNEAQQELEDSALAGKTWDNEAQYFRILGSRARSYVLSKPLAYTGSLFMGGVVTLVYPLPMRETGVFFRGEEALPKLGIAQSAMVEVMKGRIFPALKISWNERLRYFGLWVFMLFLIYAVFNLFKLSCGFRAYIVKGLRDPVLLLFLITGMYFMSLLAFGISPRMRVPVEPLLVGLAGIGLTSKRIKKLKGIEKGFKQQSQAGDEPN